MTILTGYTNVMKGYNYAITHSNADVLVFIHHDVYLPTGFEDNVIKGVSEVEEFDKNWGVLGCVGARNTDDFPNVVGWVRDRGFERSSIATESIEVDTIDELLLIVKNNKELAFDENIPTCHLYGADICLSATEKGKKNYVNNHFYCHHNSPHGYTLSESFTPASQYIGHKWQHKKPFRTTCSIFR